MPGPTTFQDLRLVLRAPPLGAPPTPNRAEHPYVGKLTFQGIPVLVETRAGGLREGTGEDGRRWRTWMLCHYGEIPATEGADGDPVDVFVGPDQAAPFAYVVHQQDPASKAYDEDKVMLGFGDKEEALRVYRRHYDRPGFVQAVRRLTIDELKAWLREHGRKGRRIHGGRELRKALGGHAR